MHPTADTTLVMYLQRLGAAGDAWRYVASLDAGIEEAGEFSMEFSIISIEIVAAIASLIATLLSGIVSALANRSTSKALETQDTAVLASISLGERGLHGFNEFDTPVRRYITARYIEVQSALRRQEKVARAYRFASSVLTFGQFIIGGLLATSFLQEHLSRPLVGGLGLLVLVSSLIRQHYRPDVKFFGARERAVKLKALIRKAEDQLFLSEEGIAEALPAHEILIMLSNGLTQVEEAELNEIQLVSQPTMSQPKKVSDQSSSENQRAT